MAKKLTPGDVDHLAKLSNLQLTDIEIEKYTTQIGETLDYVKNLEELDTSNIKESHSVIDTKNEGFEDGQKCERIFTQEEAIKNGKNKKNGYFIVKRIL